ncbi:MAG: glycosyltransferase family 9 protein [Planctomycetota bacterium]
MPEPASILVVRLSHLGDVVTTLPLVHALADRWPAARLGWAVEASFAPLLVGLQGVEVLAHARGGGLGGAWRFGRALRAFRADLVVDAQGNAKSAAWTLAAGGVHTVGLAASDWQEPWAARAATTRAPAIGRDRHAVERALGLAAFVTGRPATARFGLDISERERAAGAARWRALGGDVVLHLSVEDDVRGWPTAHWVELARRLPGSVLVAGPREAEVAERVVLRLAAAGVARPTWFGAKDLRELAATFEAAGRAGARFVGVDSGPLHVAAAVGLVPLALLGPTDARRTGPWPPSADSSLRSAEQLACAPCVARRCVHPEGPVCLTRLEPERVLAALGG